MRGSAVELESETGGGASEKNEGKKGIGQMRKKMEWGWKRHQSGREHMNRKNRLRRKQEQVSG